MSIYRFIIFHHATNFYVKTSYIAEKVFVTILMPNSFPYFSYSSSLSNNKKPFHVYLKIFHGSFYSCNKFESFLFQRIPDDQRSAISLKILAIG